MSYAGVAVSLEGTLTPAGLKHVRPVAIIAGRKYARRLLER